MIVTETNRAHFLLRRLLSSGAKLLGPYLQASGFNFGFTNAINNWGEPLAFMTSDYDFGGMIGPYGELRAEMGEARLLSRMLDGAGVRPRRRDADDGAWDRGRDRPPVGGGWPACAGAGRRGPAAGLAESCARRAARSDCDQGGRSLPIHSTLTIEPDRCPFVLFDLGAHPLAG